MEKNLKCCFCKKQIKDYGNNPAPASNNSKARCCDFCNHTIVLPARVPHLAEMFTEETYKKQLEQAQELRTKQIPNKEIETAFSEVEDEQR